MELRFEGALTSRDAKQYIPHHFELPSGCTSLEIDFRFEPKGAQGISNWPTLTLFDPHGFRGAGHRGGQHHRVAIAASAATPGYLPGALPAGEWTVEIDTHMIMPGAPVRYQLDVAASRLEARGLPPSVPPTGGEVWSSSPVGEPEGVPPARAATGWYRGDLHTHTCHSDAADFTVRDLAELAQAYGLDFVFVTDHNTISGRLAARQLPSDLPLVCDGMELTTFYGHALCLGTPDWIDWRVAPESGEIAAIAAAATGRHHLFVIAHPQADGDPDCTGCSWRFGKMMPGNARRLQQRVRPASVLRLAQPRAPSRGNCRHRCPRPSAT